MLKHCHNPKGFIEYFKSIDDIYKNVMNAVQTNI